MVAVCHTGFLNLKILTAASMESVDLHYSNKLPGDQSNSYGEMAIWWFSKRRPSTILDLPVLSSCLTDDPWIKQWRNWFDTLALSNIGVTKNNHTNKHDRDISPICPNNTTGVIAVNFGIHRDITNLTTHNKFCVNWFRGFAVLIPSIFPFSTGLASRPDNSVLLRGAQIMLWPIIGAK